MKAWHHIRIGRFYAVVGADRRGRFPFVEIGRGDRVVPLSDGTSTVLTSGVCPTFRLTIGEWSCRPSIRRHPSGVDVTLWRIWIETTPFFSRR